MLFEVALPVRSGLCSTLRTNRGRSTFRTRRVEIRHRRHSLAGEKHRDERRIEARQRRKELLLDEGELALRQRLEEAVDQLFTLLLSASEAHFARRQMEHVHHPGEDPRERILPLVAGELELTLRLEKVLPEVDVFLDQSETTTLHLMAVVAILVEDVDLPVREEAAQLVTIFEHHDTDGVTAEDHLSPLDSDVEAECPVVHPERPVLGVRQINLHHTEVEQPHPRIPERVERLLPHRRDLVRKRPAQVRRLASILGLLVQATLVAVTREAVAPHVDVGSPRPTRIRTGFERELDTLDDAVTTRHRVAVGGQARFLGDRGSHIKAILRCSHCGHDEFLFLFGFKEDHTIGVVISKLDYSITTEIVNTHNSPFLRAISATITSTGYASL